MTEILNSQMLQSKKTGFQLTKFQYHLKHTIPDIFGQGSEAAKLQNPQKILKMKRNHNNKTYYYANHSSEGIGNVDYEAIIESAKRLYVNSQCLKLSEHSFTKNKKLKVPYFPVSGDFHEIIEFYVIDNNNSTSRMKSSRIKNLTQSRLSQMEVSKIKQIEQQNPPTKSSIKALSNNFQLYIIHHCHGQAHLVNESPMKWQHFVEKYHFYNDDSGTQSKSKIEYSLILNFEENQSYLNYFSLQYKLYELFIQEYLKETSGGLENLQKIQGYLLLSKERIDRKLKEMKDVSFQESHKRWLRLPTEYYKQFTAIKKQVMTYYKTIHQNQEHSDEFISNLICRYMHAKEYNHKEASESILEYLEWQKKYSAKFNMSMFAEIHSFDFFTYLGKDLQGRAVILNKAASLKVDSITDVDAYCDYYVYYLEIWIQKRLKGYCDQYLVIADLQGLGTQHFKIAITKRNLNDSLKYSPERQYKLIVVNSGIFAKFIWGVIKPLIPKRTLSKLNILGGDSKQIVQALSRQMDISVIPEYLGGQNKRTYKDDLLEDQQQEKYLQSQ